MEDSLVVPERDIQKAILQYLIIAKKYFCWRSNTGAQVSEYKGKKRFFQFGKTGSGDIMGLTHEGKFFSIEVKRRGKKATPAQLEFMQRVNASNGIAFLAYSVDDVIRNEL